MRGQSQGRQQGRFERVELELPKAALVMREAGFDDCADDPIAGHALRDRAGEVRRMHASYPNGWRVTLVVKGNGDIVLSQARAVVSRRIGG